MNITIQPGKLRGSVDAIPSKSFAHRLLILAAFADKPTDLYCPISGRDILSTIGCLSALGAEIVPFPQGFRVFPLREFPGSAVLHCGESGSTLRFLLPIIGALGIDALFMAEGRLGSRPLSPLWEEMERMGCRLAWEQPNRLRCSGKLQPGDYHMDGSISSQFSTGLLLGLQLLPERSHLDIHGTVQSAPYLEITKEAMALFGLNPSILGGQKVRSPGRICVEGDWSNAAFFLTANALGSDVTISGLNDVSVQGDRKVISCLKELCRGTPVISAAQIPDLIPILAVAAAAKNGAVFTDIERLRLKESDRVESVASMLTTLGIRTETTENTLRIWPGKLTGGTVDAMHDHRIAMAAAIAATTAGQAVTVLGAECVEKSYPGFWEDFKLLGGQYGFNIR